MDGGLFILCSFFMPLFNRVNRCVERVNFEDVNSCEVDSAEFTFSVCSFNYDVDIKAKLII